MSDRSVEPFERVAVVGDAMAARVQAAVLESMGIEPQLRGEGLGPYPMTVGRLAEIEIWVREADAEDARAALDDADAGFDEHHAPAARGRRPSASPALAAALTVVLGLAVVLTAMRLF
jgi:hypothetical protein